MISHFESSFLSKLQILILVVFYSKCQI